ncbi:BTAD domain-containing putative transcriptional regulator [Actinoplanes sp. NBRC 103695]|uniref:BTAD domain-containing putative transcriptional regulator n=1 Tax=Actinoplanes sp. NBRC 103695 TaxID=3032202 RepID=UPI0024A55191|nr:BTAD domain-containing putative transcriptional regulator [Actinoplanes sp. NBRC 103695]GLZ01291.1 SARP family transcriptional regulator [Actinoplanes sp. NBRC 103695]
MLRVTLLDTFRATRGGAAVAVPGARLRGLVARLALAGGRPVDQDVLVDAIWPEDPPAGPAHALQSLVSRLRRVLGSPGSVKQAVGGYRLDVDAADVDALRFEQLATAGRDRLRAGDSIAAMALLGEASTLWGEHPGAEPATVAAVAPPAATRLARLSVEAIVDLADAEVALGHAGAAEARLAGLLTDQPVHERAAALLMDALAAQGRQAEALSLYERVREALADDLGVDPGTALRERHVDLLRAPAALVKPKPSNLPTPLTSLIGRDGDLARIEGLLASGRLVTVLGPGGAGKTRLAVEAARRRRHEYHDGAWMIDLSSVAEPAKVGAAVLAAIGLRGGALFDARTRADGDDLDILVEQLDGRECLLLIDNCEHLIEAVAHLCAALLSRCPGLRVLTTSREPLAVNGEALVPLGPLALPGPDDDDEQILGTASVRLFQERAAAVRPGFDIDEAALPDILRLVRGLDGLPLALELAAARLRTLSLPELAKGLSDRFRLLSTGNRTSLARHRTLRSVIAWSWDLLSDDEREVAERVSVLPGGVTSAAAVAVCAGTTVAAGDIPELLAALVDRSLVQLAADPGRYRMFETIREFGIQRLADTGRLAATRDLAGAYLARLMDAYDPQLRGPAQLTAIHIIRTEYDNTLAALRWRCDVGDAGGAVALALSLTWFWQLSGRNPDAAYWLGKALAVPGGEPTPQRASAQAVLLLSRADIHHEMTAEQITDDRTRMREVADQLLRYPKLPSPYAVFGPVLLAFLQEDHTARQGFAKLTGSGDAWLTGLAHFFQAQIAENTGEVDLMRVEVDAALACFQAVGDRWGQAATLPMRAQLRQYDDLDSAFADLREARTLAGQFGALSIGDQIDSDLRWLNLHLRQGNTDEAITMIEAVRQQALHTASAELRLLVDAREAESWLRIGHQDRAAALLDRAEQAVRSGTVTPDDHVRTLLGTLRAALRTRTGDLPGAQQALAQAYTAARKAQDLPILAVVAVHAAELAAAYGKPHESAVLLGAASRLRGTHDNTDPWICELARQGRAALGDETYADAVGRGWALAADEAAMVVDPAQLIPHPPSE